MDKHVLITIKVVLTVLVFGVGIYVLIKLAPIFATLLVALFLSLAIEPAVEHLEGLTVMNKPLSRGVAVGISYFLFLLVLAFVITFGLPPIWSQAQKLISNFGTIIADIPFLESYDVSLENLTPSITNFSDVALNRTVSLFSNLAGIISTVVLSLYISMDWENIKTRILGLFSGKIKGVLESTVEEIEENIGHWVKGQLFLMLAVGALSFFGILILGIDYPLALGLIAGTLEIIPIIGPLISLVLAAIVGFSASYVKGFMAVGLFILVQQIENNLLVPKIMEKVSGLSPLIVLIAVLVGGRFFGAIGVVLAVPITMSLVVIVKKILLFSK